MQWLARFLGIDYLKPALTAAEAQAILVKSQKSDQATCDVLNESRRKSGLSPVRCGEGLPSWEGQLNERDPAWETM